MSGISLKEVDGDLVIDVPDEQTLIGRGQFLQVTDKRVSRSHAILDVVDNKLYITPNHSNPCYLRVQGSKENTVLPKDVKQVLQHGDCFGLLPDQLYYKVSYPQVNGKNREREESEDMSSDVKEDKKNSPSESEPTVNVPKKENGIDEEKDGDEDWDKAANDVKDSKSGIKSEKSQGTKTEDEKTNKKKEVKTKIGNVALPLDKKRPLPAWMVRMAAASPPKAKPAPKKPTSTAVQKRPPGQKMTYKDYEEEDDDEEEESYVSKDTGRRKAARHDDDDDEDFDENISDDDYVPEKSSKRGRTKRKKTYSESDDDDFSDDDDDDDYYAPKKKKPKTPKKSPKGRGKKGGKVKPSPRRTPARRRKKNDSDDEDENVSLSRRRHHNDDDDDDDMDNSKQRPQRAARQKRGSYVDDPLIEEALEDFASEDDGVDVNEEKDSDFDLEGIDESGSDWEKKKKHSQKQKAPKPGQGRGSPRGPMKKGKKKTPRRSYSDDDDDDVLEDDEPYVPRPSKRRGGGIVPQPSDDSGDEKRRRRREPCQYGEKCYRKNPVHFRTYCHPGDSSYDEDDDNKPTSKDTSKRDKDSGKAAAEKPSRPQRSTAGTRLVTQGSLLDDDLPDTYDYNDSFIDDGTQPSDDSDKDSDYDAAEDVHGLAREAKKFIKTKKVTKPAQKVHD